MLGGFTCPECGTVNACNCKSCSPHIKEGEYVNTWTEDGEFLICGKCKQVYSPDAALDAEWNKRKEALVEVTNDNWEETSWKDIEDQYHSDEYPVMGGPFTNALSFKEYLKEYYYPPIRK